MYKKSILLKLIEVITGKERYQVIDGVHFEWSNKSWTHNIFRRYELLFGRRTGIRLEMSSWLEDGKEYHFAHTFEAGCALFETHIRKFLSSFEFNKYRLYIPMFQTHSGIKVPASPYLFAIAYDATSETTGTTSLSVSHTCTGSNVILCSGAFNLNTGDALTSWTYNSINMVASPTTPTSHQSNMYVYLYYKFAPTTGANTLAISFSASAGGSSCTNASYSGVDSTQLDSSGSTTNSTAAANITVSSTITTANSWQVMFERCEVAGVSAGTGTTIRGTTGGDHCICDSNGALTTGSKSLVINFSSAKSSGNLIGILQYPFTPPSSIKSVNGLAKASIKSVNGLAIASIKSINSLA